MTSGDTLVIARPADGVQPPTNFAVFDLRNNHPILRFDAATSWAIVFGGVIPRNYTGSGITLTIIWTSDTAVTGNVIWRAAFERLNSTFDIDADSYDTAQSSAAAAAPAAAGGLVYTTISFSNSQIDGLGAGEAFRLKVDRDAANGSDTMAGDAEILRVELKET